MGLDARNKAESASTDPDGKTKATNVKPEIHLPGFPGSVKVNRKSENGRILTSESTKFNRFLLIFIETSHF